MGLQPYAGAGGYQPGPHDVVGQVGDISFTPTTIHLPGRSVPMAGSIWTVRDSSRMEESTPQWAIIVAILGFFFVCFLSLFFLLVKERRVSGWVEVEVRTGGDYHVAQVPAYDAMVLARVRQQVDYARSLSTWAAGQR